MRVEKPDVVLVHSSNDRYGSDRVLLQVVETLADRSIEIWLPDDLGDDGPLSSTLRARGHAVRVLPLPILRRISDPAQLAGFARALVPGLGIDQKNAPSRRLPLDERVSATRAGRPNPGRLRDPTFAGALGWCDAWDTGVLRSLRATRHRHIRVG